MAADFSSRFCCDPGKLFLRLVVVIIGYQLFIRAKALLEMVGAKFFR